VAGYAGTRAPDRPESGLLESGGDRSLERVELEKGVERGAVRRRADKAPHPIEAHDIVFLEQREVGFTERRVDPLAQLVDRRPDRRVAFGIGEPADERSEGIGSSVASTQRRISHRRSLSTTREIVSPGGGRPSAPPSLPRRNRSEAVGVGSGWIVIGTRKSGTAH